MFWRRHQHVLETAPGGLPSMFLGNSTRRPPQHVLARTPACLGVNASMSWQQHTAFPACLGTNSNMSWQQHQATSPDQHQQHQAASPCLGTNTSMSWRQHQNALTTAPGGLPSMLWRQHQHVLASTPACLGNSTSGPPSMS